MTTQQATCGHDRPGNGSTLAKMRGAAPKSCVCATSRLAPTHVPALSGLPGVLERSKVAFGSRHPGNLGNHDSSLQS
jgi:hypothetical protein